MKKIRKIRILDLWSGGRHQEQYQWYLLNSLSIERLAHF